MTEASAMGRVREDIRKFINKAKSMRWDEPYVLRLGHSEAEEIRKEAAELCRYKDENPQEPSDLYLFPGEKLVCVIDGVYIVELPNVL